MQKLDAAGEVAMSVAYDAFGQLTSGQLVGEYGFSSKPRITGINWYYYGFRYYDPETGRWPNRDPSGEAFSRNLYGFTDNNTINYVDVLGLAPFSPSSFGVGSNYYQGGGSTQTYNQGAIEEFSDAVDNTLNFVGEQLAGEIEGALMDLSGITNPLLKMGLSELLNPTVMGNDRRTEFTLADSDSSACPKDSSDCVFGPKPMIVCSYNCMDLVGLYIESQFSKTSYVDCSGSCPNSI